VVPDQDKEDRMMTKLAWLMLGIVFMALLAFSSGAANPTSPENPVVMADVDVSQDADVQAPAPVVETDLDVAAPVMDVEPVLLCHKVLACGQHNASSELAVLNSQRETLKNEAGERLLWRTGHGVLASDNLYAREGKEPKHRWIKA